MEPVSDNEAMVPTGQRPCPICGNVMLAETHEGVVIDVCEQHGVWLDRGELPHIAARIRSGQFADRQAALRRARRDGKLSGALLGVWALLWD